MGRASVVPKRSVCKTRPWVGLRRRRRLEPVPKLKSDHRSCALSPGEVMCRVTMRNALYLVGVVTAAREEACNCSAVRLPNNAAQSIVVPRALTRELPSQLVLIKVPETGSSTAANMLTELSARRGVPAWSFAADDYARVVHTNERAAPGNKEERVRVSVCVVPALGRREKNNCEKEGQISSSRTRGRAG